MIERVLNQPNYTIDFCFSKYIFAMGFNSEFTDINGL
jgi:hypothetical protein